ncbi:MAG: biotin synthase BioB [Gemmatimonadetes bacterium]|nr:biotin synthase BioB [Gemmatimonadota bacterium]
MDYHIIAEKALQDIVLSTEEMETVLDTPPDALLQLLQSAFEVRKRYFGMKVHLHVLQNAKSGLCPEDCGYCSQSSVSNASIEKYPMLPRQRIVQAARDAYNADALRYYIVTSGRGPTQGELEFLAGTVREIKGEIDIEICCCVGLLSQEQAFFLKDAGVDRVNHNLNTSNTHHGNIVSTHTFQDRVATIKAVQAAGISTCCGGILGMGERREDIIELALTIRELDIDSIPVNFLHPIEGTPLETQDELTPHDCLKTLCLFRFLNPRKEIRVAGGREHNLRPLQPLALYPANSMFMDGYLTTEGQNASDAHRMIEDMGFEIESTMTDKLIGISLADTK